MLRDHRSTAAPAVHADHSRPIFRADGSKLALKEPGKPVVVRRDHYLTAAPHASEQVSEAQEVDVVKTLEGIVKGRQLKRQGRDGQIQSEEGDDREHVELGA